jgi:hypothetical protein
MLLPYCQRPCFAPIQNHRQNYTFVYSNFCFWQQTRIQKVLDWMVASIARIQFPLNNLLDARNNSFLILLLLLIPYNTRLKLHP